MKILHCIPSLRGGGSERNCCYLSRELTRLGADVHLAVVRDEWNGQSDPLSAAGTIHVLGRGRTQNLRQAQRRVGVLFRLMKLMRRLKPDVVQSWNRPMDVFAGVAAHALHRPWILSERSSCERYHDRRERLRLMVARWADAIVCNSEGGGKYWAAHARPGTRREVIPNLLPVERIRGDVAAAQSSAPAAPAIRLLFVGRFCLEKNIPVMMEALCRGVTSLPAEAILLGDGEERARAEALVRERGLSDKFFFKGYQERPWREMSRASMLLLVSRHEGRPNVVCEAMAVRCPVILSDIPAHRSLFDERHALFVRPDDPEDMVRAMRELLAQPDRTAGRVVAAERLVCAWNSETIARRYLELYRQCTP